jgi:hypothetical protein
MIGAIVGSALSAGIGAIGSSRAASAQADAAKAQMKFTKKVYRQSKRNLKPYREMGQEAIQPYMYNMGLAERPENYVDFTGTPGYDFRFNEGTNAVQSLASARGSLHSGRTMEALNRFGQGIASEEYGGYMNRMRDLIGVGQNASVQTADSGYNAMQGMMGGLSNYGNAQAAGSIGMANALTQGIGNIFGAYQYQQGLTGQQPSMNTSIRPMARPFG